MTSSYGNWTAQRTTEYSSQAPNSRNGIASTTRAAFRIPGRLFAYTKYAYSNPIDGRRMIRRWVSANLGNSLTVVILVWICLLYYGESFTFNRAIASCQWSRWEKWPQEANPHHLVFVADPQLVDPHTYPGRPWPVSTLTIKHTDLYLRRAFSRIERVLDPSTVIFLGDLFDGGREWSTSTTQSPEEQYRKYGDIFWHQELDRFKSIFLREWSSNAVVGKDSGRRIMTSLPGNHDLGFGMGVQIPVRERFIAAFGDVNRIDVIANHTFVSLDSVSLSAKDHEKEPGAYEIWKPTDDFLASAMTKQAQAIQSSLHSSMKNARRSDEHTVKATISKLEPRSSLDLPTILLTHVPLYRAPGTPCGPLRERHPPTAPPPGQTTPVFPDDRNAISVSDGYQYQNVLSEPLTRHILSKLGNDVEYAFSGDDHDYCEVLHSTYPSKEGRGILEITVKSISWAMGVRKPGILLVSLWNPLDDRGKSLKPPPAKGEQHQRTLQTHLCVLPDQLSIFIRYATLFALSLVFLFLRALILVFHIPYLSPSKTPQSPFSPSYSLLPTVQVTRRRGLSSAEREKAVAASAPYAPSWTYPEYPGASTSKANPALAADDGFLSARMQTRSRSVPSPGTVVEVYEQSDGRRDWEEEERLYDDERADSYDDGFGNSGGGGAARRKGKVRAVLEEWGWGLWCVARVAVPVYGGLLVWG